ncbi:M16 family metallopeptidase [Nanoarchaeota archaeon]
MKKKRVPKLKSVVEPKLNKNLKVMAKKDIQQSYIVFGFQTVPRKSKDRFVLEVIRGVLGRPQSGTLFTEIRLKRGLCYSIGVYHDAGEDYGVYAIYCGTRKKNLKLVRKLVNQEIEKIKDLSEKDLKVAKSYLEGDYIIKMEDNINVADLVAHNTLLGLDYDYIKEIKKVTLKDIKKVYNKYLKHYVEAVVMEK